MNGPTVSGLVCCPADQCFDPNKSESEFDVFWFGDPGENPESLELVDPRSVPGLLGTLDDLLMVTGCGFGSPGFLLVLGMVRAPAPEFFGESGSGGGGRSLSHPVGDRISMEVDLLVSSND